MANQNTTLYTDDKQRFFFIVPDDVNLPEGRFTIYAPLGKARNVHPNFMRYYEVNREQAQEWMRERLKTGTQVITDGIQDFLKALQAKQQQKAAGQSSAINMDFAADLLGESVEDLQRDTEAAKRGWLRLLSEAKEVVEGARSDNEDDLQHARNIMHGLANIIREHGVNVSDAWEELPDKINESYRRAKDMQNDDADT